MRLLILSDLHLEVWRDNAPAIDLSGRPDAVILAGDIDTGSNAIDWAARTLARCRCCMCMAITKAMATSWS